MREKFWQLIDSDRAFYFVAYPCMCTLAAIVVACTTSLMLGH